MFHRPGRRLACAGALLVAAAAQVSAGDAMPRNTVFKSDAGEAWTVSIKPATRTAKAEPRALPVPSPMDVTPAVALVQATEPAAPPAELPPIPPMQDPAAGVRSAHGVTVSPDVRSSVELLGLRYAEAYRSIPFNRAEYDANPSYRHEAAMELVFGQMRPTTIVKQMGGPAPEQPVESPYRPYLPSYSDVWPHQVWPLRNPVFDPPIAPNGCYWPAF